MPRVSVVIPTYNRADLISQTLDSVLAQTFGDYEIIVVDDGSTDDTSVVLSTYGNRIRVIRQSNQGEGPARNTGIRQAQGDFVAFLDSDDLWLPSKLERQMALLDAGANLAWVYSDAEVFDSETNRTLYLRSRFARLYQGDVLEPLLLKNFITSPTPIVRRAVFDEVGYFWDSPKAADWDMWLRVAAKYPVGLVDEPLARYRIHQGMISAKQSWREKIDACMTVIEHAVDRNPKRLAPLKNRAVARLYIGAGRALAQEENLSKARKMFVKAIQLAPLTKEAYIYWLGCSVGRPALNVAIRLRRWLRHKRSVGWTNF